jgi:hypothetical protein
VAVEPSFGRVHDSLVFRRSAPVFDATPVHADVATSVTADAGRCLSAKCRRIMMAPVRPCASRIASPGREAVMAEQAHHTHRGAVNEDLVAAVDI